MLEGRMIGSIALSAAIAGASCAAGASAQPGAHNYAGEKGIAGVVDLYDLSSVARTARGFVITEVVVSHHFPHVFGDVAYRVRREDYACGRGTYTIDFVRDHRSNGKTVVSLGRSIPDGLRVVAGTASSEMSNRFCLVATTGKLAGLAASGVAQAATPYAAYRLGLHMIDGSS